MLASFFIIERAGNGFGRVHLSFLSRKFTPGRAECEKVKYFKWI